jgi:glycosyltransferase involved in cell wall biosynthesis
MEKNIVVSILCPLHNDAEILSAFLSELSEVMRRSFEFYEIILIDDGSQDDTAAVLAGLFQNTERLRCLTLSRQNGREVAISAGLESAIGDFVVIMLPRTDPPSLVPDFVRACREGDGLVTGISKTPKRAGFLSLLGSRLFHGYCRRYLGFDFQENTTDFRCLSRNVVNAVTRFHDRHRYLRIFTARIGFRHQTISYRLLERGGKIPPESLLTEINHAIEIVVANSKHPLRFVSRLGLFLSALNALYIGYIVAIFLFKRQVAEGWTTSSLESATMFFFLFLILAVLCEYAGRILEESQDRPLYFISEEKNSPVTLEATMTKNIVNESASET